MEFFKWVDQSYTLSYVNSCHHVKYDDSCLRMTTDVLYMIRVIYV